MGARCRPPYLERIRKGRNRRHAVQSMPPALLRHPARAAAVARSNHRALIGFVQLFICRTGIARRRSGHFQLRTGGTSTLIGPAGCERSAAQVRRNSFHTHHSDTR